MGVGLPDEPRLRPSFPPGQQRLVGAGRGQAADPAWAAGRQGQAGQDGLPASTR